MLFNERHGLCWHSMPIRGGRVVLDLLGAQTREMRFEIAFVLTMLVAPPRGFEEKSWHSPGAALDRCCSNPSSLGLKFA